ncbi:MAG: histidinol-phosphate transaminase [Flavobacteriales bacterium]|jgi:histidinol-phosphate aminotransferase|nr:histidinol-phosphate transaminase [Flavobacteriales bacterium]
MKNYLRKHLQNHAIYQSARQEFTEGAKEMILLDANENPFDWPYNRYPDPMQQKLRSKICEWRQVKPDELYLANGSDEIINQLILAFCEPGEEEILICPPTFGMYKVAAQLYQVDLCEVPLTKTFQLDMPALEAAIKPHSKLCFIPTPNNPTGNRFATEDLQQLARLFPGILVIDEAYAEFSPEVSTLSWQAEYPNVLVLQTFSKAQGMAGARLGMAFGHKTIMEGLHKVKGPYNLNDLTLDAVCDQIENQQDRVKEMVVLMTRERERIVAAIEDLPYIKTIFPSDANFFMIRVDDSQLRYQQLLDHSIVVRNASKNILCDNCLRISIGTVSENNQLIKVLRTLL